jgi:Uma2 family endonuclease
MATVLLNKKTPRRFGPESTGILMSPQEFDHAEFAEGWRYDLINGVLIVSPIPSLKERDPNEELGHWLRKYKEDHPQGAALDLTIHEHTVITRNNRRRSDRVIWAGLGRLPRKNEAPTIIAEFVSSGKRDRTRDYEEKRREYLAIKVQEYWVIDRFQRVMTVFMSGGKKKIVREHQSYKTPLLPGFEFPLAKLLAMSDRWPDDVEE